MAGLPRRVREKVAANPNGSALRVHARGTTSRMNPSSSTPDRARQQRDQTSLGKEKRQLRVRGTTGEDKTGRGTRHALDAHSGRSNRRTGPNRRPSTSVTRRRRGRRMELDRPTGRRSRARSDPMDSSPAAACPVGPRRGRTGRRGAASPRTRSARPTGHAVRRGCVETGGLLRSVGGRRPGSDVRAPVAAQGHGSQNSTMNAALLRHAGDNGVGARMQCFSKPPQRYSELLDGVKKPCFTLMRQEAGTRSDQAPIRRNSSEQTEAGGPTAGLTRRTRAAAAAGGTRVWSP